MTSFEFYYKGHEMRGYFHDNKLIYFDELGYEYLLSEEKAIESAAIEQYQTFLDEQEANAKDFDNLKYHLESQFKIR